MNRRPLTDAFAALLLAATFLTPPAMAQEAAPAEAAATEIPTVPVRAGIHPAYARLVFDWNTPVPHVIERNGDRVTVRFAAPGRADLARARRINPPRVADLTAEDSSEQGMAVSFTVPPGAVLKDFRNGTRLVIDVSDPPPSARAAAAPQPPAAEAAEPAPAAQPAASAAAAAKPSGSASEDVPLYKIPGRGSGTEEAQEAARQQAAEPQQARPVVADRTPQPLAPAQETPQEPSAPPPSPPQPAAAAIRTETAPPAHSAAQIVFDPRKPTAAVMFERAGWFYVLFDRVVDAQPSGPALGGFTGTVEKVELEEGSGYRLALPPLAVPRVERDGTRWSISLEQADATGGPASIDVRPDPDFALGARVVIAAEEADTILRFQDPVVGDVLHLVPLPVAGQRLAEPRRFREAELLPTVQGLAIRPLDDRLEVRAVREGVDMTVPGGLRLSPEEDALTANPPVVAAEPEALFDFDRWGRVAAKDMIPTRQVLWQRETEAPAELRDKARLDLARFYAANGFGTEALAMLSLVQQEQPDIDRRPEFLAVRGVGRALTGDIQGAQQDLSARDLGGEPDADLWRAMAASKAGDHALAHRLFTARRDRLDSFPDPFFTRIAMAAVDSALAQGAVETAALLTDRLVKRGAEDGSDANHVRYRRARVQQALGDTAKAKKTLAGLAAGDDRLNRTLATRDLIELRLGDGEITAQQAAEEYEKLRFAWRGDGLELAIQRRLGEMHVLAGNYAQAFDTMRRTISLFPDDPQAAEIANQMTGTFTDLFLKDGAAHLSPLEALSLYEQYRELTPPGADGDRIIRRLAERLVEIDLLDRAAELLDRQVQFRLSGAEKAKVGARLAAIRLLDNRPDDALTALDKSNAPDLPPSLEEERRLLRARALSRTGRGADAVQLLAADSSRPAALLRIDIAWRDKQWPAAAQALADVIGPPPADGTKIPAETAKLVVNQAVALSLAQDDAGLATLRDRFGPAMGETAEAQMFTVLTRPGEPAGLVDLNSIQARMAEIDTFRSFLDGYRTRQEASAVPPSGPLGN